MTTLMYWFCVAMFVLGQAAHLFLLKIPEMRKTANALNKGFYFKEWWKCDWNIIIGTQVIGAMFILGLDQFLHWKPEIIDYVKWFFALLGAFGSTIAMTYGSKYADTLKHLVDIKSNVSDAITGGSNTVQETIQKAGDVGVSVEASLKK
jgi:hypothetical protein